MMNAPTNRATNAKIKRNVLKNERLLLMLLLCSWASFVPVIASY